MGLSCLFGHDFGRPTHEQERERHGEEVVLTSRDVKRCRRCGSEQVITENTAVVKREAVLPELETDDSRSEPTTEADEGAATTEAATATGSRTTSGPNTTLSTEHSIGDGSETERGGPEITDDAVILTDGSTEERHPMEWPGGRTAGEPSAASGSEHPEEDESGPEIPFDPEPEPSGLGCENCDASYAPTMSSLRAGDLCPRCRSAYLSDTPE